MGNSFLDWLGLHLRSLSQTIEQKPWKRGHDHGYEDVKENVCDIHIKEAVMTGFRKVEVHPFLKFLDSC